MRTVFSQLPRAPAHRQRPGPKKSTLPSLTTVQYEIVFIHHGESTWNLQNRFTGWTDVELTPTGVEQARQSERLLEEAGFEFDVAYTSVHGNRAAAVIPAGTACLTVLREGWQPVRVETLGL